MQVVTPLGKEVQVMIPENASPGDVLDVFDETSHKVHVLLAPAPAAAVAFATRGGHRCVASNHSINASFYLVLAE